MENPDSLEIPEILQGPLINSKEISTLLLGKKYLGNTQTVCDLIESNPQMDV